MHCLSVETSDPATRLEVPPVAPLLEPAPQRPRSGGHHDFGRMAVVDCADPFRVLAPQ